MQGRDPFRQHDAHKQLRFYINCDALNNSFRTKFEVCIGIANLA